MSRLFGTDGVRGIAGKDLTAELARNLGWAGALALTKETSHQPTIIVGQDTRVSGQMLADALMEGICSVGANAVFVGMIPTPAVAYLTRAYKADAGIMISASHNPVEFNGIKFFNQSGYKLPDQMEDEIEALIQGGWDQNYEANQPGEVRKKDDAVDDYIEHEKSQMPLNLTGLRIVIDCAEGASYVSSTRALSELGAEVIACHVNPNGLNINKDCGSTHMGEICRRVVEERADVGFAFDGDADRCLCVDETGKIVDGDQMMAVCGNYLKKQGRLKKNTIVGTVMSNLGFSLMGEKQGIDIVRTKVGDRYVLESMLENHFNLGGEQSGHLIFLDENSTGDGLLSALHILEVMTATKEKLSELAKVMDVLPQALVNAPVPERKKHSYLEYPEIVNAIQDLEEKYAGEGRVLIRPSGTEPLVRVMIEGKNQEEINQQAQELADLIRKTMQE